MVILNFCFLSVLSSVADPSPVRDGDQDIVDLTDSSSGEDEVVGTVLPIPSISRALDISDEGGIDSDEDGYPLPSISAPVTRSSTKAARSSSIKKSAKTRKSLVVLPSLYHIHVEDPISHSESDRDTTIFPVQPARARGRGRGRARGRAIPQIREKGKKKAKSSSPSPAQALSLDEMRGYIPRLDAAQVQNVEKSLSDMRHVSSSFLLLYFRLVHRFHFSKLPLVPTVLSIAFPTACSKSGIHPVCSAELGTKPSVVLA